MKDDIAEALGIESESELLPIIQYTKEPIQTTHTEQDLQDDFETSREMLNNLIVNGERALEGIIQVANETQSPRSFEIAAQMISTLAGVSKDMISLHKENKKIADTSSQKSNDSTINNNAIFVGSSEELIDMLNNETPKVKSVVTND